MKHCIKRVQFLFGLNSVYTIRMKKGLKDVSVIHSYDPFRGQFHQPFGAKCKYAGAKHLALKVQFICTSIIS